MTRLSNTDQVVLVDEHNHPIDVCLKHQVHTNHTPLHRAFSFFLFNLQSQVLVQQRSLSKTAWPGFWSNSCCGHVSPYESTLAAIRRRVKEELGATIKNIIKVSDYRYCFSHHGIMENEICPVYRGLLNSTITINLAEITQISWLSWQELLTAINHDKNRRWSPWIKEEVQLFKL